MRRSPLLPIFLIVLVDVLALAIMIPLLPFYAQRHGASPFTYGLLVASFSVCQLVGGPLLGALSDRYGRRPLLIVSQVGTLAGLLLLAWADRVWLIFLARMLDGATAGNLSVAQAYVADVTRPDNRARAFGLIGVAFGLGFVVGPALTSVLSPYGYAVPVLAAAALSASSVLCTYFLLPAAPPRPEGAEDAAAAPRKLGILQWGAYRGFFARGELGGLLAQFFCFALAFAMFTGGFALFAERRFTWDGHPFGAREVGLTYVYVGVLGILLQGGILGRLVERFGERRLITTGFLLAAVAYVALGWAFTIAPLLLCAAVSAVGTGMLRPTLTAEITNRVERSEQGTVLGLTQSLWSVGMIVAPPLGNALIATGRLTAWTLALAACSLAGLALAVRRR